MQQIQLAQPGGLENLKLTEVEVPTLNDHQVLVRVQASSLNYHDLLVALGKIPTDNNRVPLSDCGGEIVDIGNAVSKWKIGDQVMSSCFPNWLDGQPRPELLSFIGDHQDGYACEYIAIAETALTATPKGWSALQAATLPCAGLTVWRALIDEGNLQPGESSIGAGYGWGVNICPTVGQGDGRQGHCNLLERRKIRPTARPRCGPFNQLPNPAAVGQSGARGNR